MNYLTKKKIKNFFKQKWQWFLGTGLFLIIGGTIALIGFSVSGWSLIEWLKSPWAITTLVMVLFGLYGGIMLIVFWYKFQALK